jgi:1,4-dihydroxy-2-naphthoyl-CoA hydrolase
MPHSHAYSYRAYSYTVRLADTDAARVVYFASILRICHEAYEDALQQAEIDLGSFLSDAAIAIPIVACEARFFAPMRCGDCLSISVRSQLIGETEFKLDYEVKSVGTEKLLATASTSHVCIQVDSRRRCDLPDFMLRWLTDLFAK